jgi:phage shock protein PspC (stress-responsive transcriptional regulator)
VAGVAGGIADELGLPATAVRVGFVVLGAICFTWVSGG